MDLRLFATVFATIFVAELGDKTQLATLLYASDANHPRLTVFAASASALVLTSALGVLGGAVIAGLGFVAVGIWVLASGDGSA
jgi:putative Ca2+/H+ antiporter (TMEM165/GDT1 family)